MRIAQGGPIRFRSVVVYRLEGAFAGSNRQLADYLMNQTTIDSSIDLRMVMKRREFEGLILPLVLLLTGLILVGGDRMGILSLDRIQNLWPMALILIGLTDFLDSSNAEPGAQVAAPSHASREDVRRV